MKRVTSRAWTCAGCLQRSAIVRRGLITSAKSQNTAAAAAVADFQPVSHTAPSIAHDDRTLRQIFDYPAAWSEFSAKYKGGRNAGILQNRYLTHPEGFQEFAAITLRKCQRVVARVLAYKTTQEYKRAARDLDRLSDLLCRVIDLSDFVRSVHPNRKIQAAASEAYGQMFEYMNVLNTTTGLNEQLKKASEIPEVWASWSEEERTVAGILMRDFEKSAIDLPETERQAFVDISNEIAVVGTEFVDNMAAERPVLQFQSSKLKGMDPVAVKQLTRWGSVTLPTVGMPATMALRTVEDAETRRAIYMASRTSSREGVERLEQLVTRRAELAKLSGYESYAQMALEDKMAASPEAVSGFLHALAGDNAARAQKEVAELLALKQADASVAQGDNVLKAWDRDYYTHKLTAANRQQRIQARHPDFLSAYFSLGTVFQGLSRLFHRLYSIRLVPSPTLPGETWTPEVRRLDVWDDHEGHIGVVYCDLFAREGKSPNPAHFTLRCSRRIGEEELREAALNPDSRFESAEEAANDGLPVARHPRDNDALYALPTIALICDFPPPAPPSANSSKTTPTLLTLRDVTTLFHEMGHALHSLLGRTSLQTIAGTRCATDFAELPSVLMENFATDPGVLGLWARHWETDQPLDASRVTERLQIESAMAGSEVEGQVLLGVLDQQLHSSLPLSWANQGSGIERSTQIYRSVWERYASVPEPVGTSWQGFFGHLVGYGASYYSYLFDRAIAGKIWRDVFEAGRTGGAVDARAGERLRHEVLRHGGGRDGWKCVGGVLGGEEGERVRGGGAVGMREVGRWGVHG